MAGSLEYFVNNLSLSISPKGLVVEVHELKDEPPRYDKVTDLPDWIFRSSLAIWFKEGEASLYQRAIAGEKIKNELMMELPLQFSTHRSPLYKQ
jgi:hypothetical protein